MDKYTLPGCTLVYSEHTELPLTFDESLPEHLPGIGKVVGAKVYVTDITKTAEQNLLALSGTLSIQVLYLAENNHLPKCVSFTEPFEKTLDIAALPSISGSPYIEISVSAPAASAKPKSARLLELRVPLGIHVGVYECEGTPLLSPDEVPEACLHECTVSCSVHKKLAIEGKTMQEEISLDSSMPAIAELLDGNVSLNLENIHTEQGRLCYTGKALLKGVYRAADSTSESNADSQPEYIFISKEIPLEGEIEESSITGGLPVCGRLQTENLRCTAAYDPYGECRKINADISYRGAFDIFDNAEIVYYDDGFCADYASEFTRQVLPYERLDDTFSRSIHMEEVLSGDRNDLVEINDASMTLEALRILPGEAEKMLEGKASFIISGLNEEGEMCRMQSVKPIRFPADFMGEFLSDVEYIMNAEPQNVKAVLREGNVTVSADVGIHGAVLEKCRLNALTHADIHYDAPKPLCSAEYIIYYPAPGEKLWDIAKKYEISEQRLKDENNMTSDTLSGKKTIRIPCENAAS